MGEEGEESTLDRLESVFVFFLSFFLCCLVGMGVDCMGVLRIWERVGCWMGGGKEREAREREMEDPS